jgi:lipoprotein-releasing system permease protein
MNVTLTVRIAKSLMLARWKQTLVAAIGVTFSITMFITLLSFMSGLNDLLDGIMLNRVAHVRLYNEVQPNKHQPINNTRNFSAYHNFIASVKSAGSRQNIYNSASIIAALKSDYRVLGLTARLTAQVFFNDGTIAITGIVNGIDVTQESKLFHFNDYITAGNAVDIARVPNSVLLGSDLADKLTVYPGDMVQVTTATGELFRLKVVGLFKTGIKDFDKMQSYASIASTQKLLGQPADYITDIEIKLKDMNTAPAQALEYANLFGTDAEDIQTANAQFETGSSIRTLISYAVGITLLIVAGFGIYNILNMMIFEKMDTIAILKATGFSGTDVKRIFLLIALSIGFFGGIAGLLLGFGLSAVIDHVPFSTAALPTVTTYPINYNPVFYVIGTVFSLLTTWLAGWFPARKASKVDPVIIIRGK